MSKKLQILIISLITFCLAGSVSYAQDEGDYRTAQSGAWADVSTWEQYISGSWSTASDIPVYNDGSATTIISGHYITFDGSAVEAQRQYASYIKKTTIEAGATVQITAGSMFIYNDGTPPNMIIYGELRNNYQLKFHNGATGAAILVGDGGVLTSPTYTWGSGIVPGGDGSVYIATAGSGTVTTRVSSAATILVGTETIYAPVDYTPVANSQVTINVVSTTDGSNSGADRVQIGWTITSGQNYYPGFQWPTGAEGANFAAGRADAKLYNGSTLVPATLTGADPYNLTAVNSQFAGTAIYGIGLNLTALPVELSSFSAQTVEQGVQLKWTTATELNNYGFDIERRNEISDWEKIGFVQGIGNSSTTKEYSFTDKTGGQYFYRLKQIDLDGKFKYSDEVEVSSGLPQEFLLSQNYPNPFNPTTTITYQIPAKSNVVLKVYDVLGSEVSTLVNREQAAGKYDVKFNGSALSSGIYFYSIQAGDFFSVRKLMLVK